MKLYGGKYSAITLLELLKNLGTKIEVARALGIPKSTIWDYYEDIKLNKDTNIIAEEDMEGGINEERELKNLRVLAMGDTHFPATLPGYVDFCKSIYDKHECNHIVHLGDACDQYYINFHEKDIGLVECDREYEATKEMMKHLFKTFPNGTWIVGNHDNLSERKRKNLFLPKFVIKQLRDIYDVPKSWNIVNKAIIDDVLYIHRFKGGGANPHALAAKKLGMSVVLGHHHFSSGISYYSNLYKMHFGMCVGCGVDRDNIAFKDRMEYSEDCISREIISCGVVYNSKRAYLEPMPL